MTTSNDFRLEPSETFEKSLLALENQTYGRHDKKGREALRASLAKIFVDLCGWPNVAGCRKEPFPSNIGAEHTAAGWTFHKLEFSTPRANGAARQGRLMLLVHMTDRVIVPTYIYTHQQFPGRVPDGSLTDRIAAVVHEHRREKASRADAAPAGVPVAAAEAALVATTAKEPKG